GAVCIARRVAVDAGLVPGREAVHDRTVWIVDRPFEEAVRGVDVRRRHEADRSDQPAARVASVAGGAVAGAVVALLVALGDPVATTLDRARRRAPVARAAVAVVALLAALHDAVATPGSRRAARRQELVLADHGPGRDDRPRDDLRQVGGVEVLEVVGG